MNAMLRAGARSLCSLSHTPPRGKWQ